MKLYRGVPCRNCGTGKEHMPTCTIRIHIKTKNKLEGYRKKLQKNHWEHISYTNVIEYLLSNMSKECNDTEF